jgi:hypothetical protein
VKLARLLSRIVLLSLAAAAFVGLTGMYGRSVRTVLPNPGWQAERAHRQSAPQVRYFFTEFGGELILMAVFAAVGRIIFRLRLSPPSRSEGQPTLLDLRTPRLAAPSDPEVAARNSASDPA